MTREVARYADVAMYRAKPLEDAADEDGRITPRVHLVSMTADPLRVMAAAAQLYAGEPVYSPATVSKSTALRWLADMTKTRLQAPLEFIDLHFLLEGA